MKTFTQKQIEELLEIIDVHILKFVGTNINKEYLTAKDFKLLKKYGINVMTQTKLTVEQAFKFGILSQALGTSKVNSMDYLTFKKSVMNKTFLPLDYREVVALQNLEFQAYNEIKGLGNTIKKDFSRILIDTDKVQREKYEAIIKDTARQTLLDRGGVKQMSSDLGHKTGDWARDFNRISDYILHEAHDHGRAMGIERHDGKDALVFKRVFDEACKSCVSLYLSAGVGSEPKIFKLSELRANGTNVGRKVADWKPVIGATHPYCRCNLEYVPKSSVWNPTEKKFKIEARDERAAELAKRSRTLGLVKIIKS